METCWEHDTPYWPDVGCPACNANAEIARLQAEVEHWKGAATARHPNPADHRYWEGRYRDEAAEVERLRAERRMIVSHATMGAVSGEGMTVNAVSCEITKVRNMLYDDGQKKADTIWNDAIEAAASKTNTLAGHDETIRWAVDEIRALKRGEAK